MLQRVVQCVLQYTCLYLTDNGTLDSNMTRVAMCGAEHVAGCVAVRVPGCAAVYVVLCVIERGAVRVCVALCDAVCVAARVAVCGRIVARYRVANMHRMPSLCRVLIAKEP